MEPETRVRLRWRRPVCCCHDCFRFLHRCRCHIQPINRWPLRPLHRRIAALRELWWCKTAQHKHTHEVSSTHGSETEDTPQAVRDLEIPKAAPHHPQSMPQLLRLQSQRPDHAHANPASEGERFGGGRTDERLFLSHSLSDPLRHK